MKLTSRPPITISPESASSSPATTRRIVLFPQPEGPRRTRNSPSAICRDTSLTASTLPKRLTRCFTAISATRLHLRMSLLERAGHRRLDEPPLEDQEDDRDRDHRHDRRGRDDPPVRDELPLERRDPDRQRPHVVRRRRDEWPEEVHPLRHEHEDPEDDDRRLDQRQHDPAEDEKLGGAVEARRLVEPIRQRADE